MFSLKQRIDKWSYRTTLGKNNQSTKKEEKDHYREQPITLSDLQELPEFGDDGLIRHVILLNIVLETVPWVVRVQCEIPSKTELFCRA